MVLTFKYTSVWTIRAITSISNRCPFLECSLIYCSIRLQNIFIHNNIRGQDCIRRCILRLARKRTIYKSCKPVKLTCITDLINRILAIVPIYIILVCGKLCRLVYLITGTETILANAVRFRFFRHISDRTVLACHIFYMFFVIFPSICNITVFVMCMLFSIYQKTRTICQSEFLRIGNARTTLKSNAFPTCNR